MVTNLHLVIFLDCVKTISSTMSSSVGCIIENMSGRKLTYVVGGLAVMQISCFLLGAIVSPSPNSSMQVIMSIPIYDFTIYNIRLLIIFTKKYFHH